MKALIQAMSGRIADILVPCEPSIYLYGSWVLHDFRPGWSDIDILVLTQRYISEEQALRLVSLRQTMAAETGDPGYRSFEGGMLTLDSLLSGERDRVVYWGTSGERVMEHYHLDAFCRRQLMEDGLLLHGEDLRNRLPRPTFRELRADIQKHYETIRQYGRTTGRSLYSFGWLLDISRCLYTLRTGRIIAKTAAGEWALGQGLCPCPSALAQAVAIRREPERYCHDENILDYAATLGPCAQRYADILEGELAAAEGVN